MEDVEFLAAQNIIHCCCWRMSLWTCVHTCDCCLCYSNCSESAVIVFCFYLFLLGLDFSSFTCFPESLQLLLGWWGIHYYFSLIEVLCMEACRQIRNGDILHHEEEGVPSSDWTLLWWLLLLLLRGPSEYFFAGIFQNCWQKGKNWVLLCKFCPTAVACWTRVRISVSR